MQQPISDMLMTRWSFQKMDKAPQEFLVPHPSGSRVFRQGGNTTRNGILKFFRSSQGKKAFSLSRDVSWADRAQNLLQYTFHRVLHTSAGSNNDRERDSYRTTYCGTHDHFPERVKEASIEESAGLGHRTQEGCQINKASKVINRTEKWGEVVSNLHITRPTYTHAKGKQT